MIKNMLLSKRSAIALLLISTFFDCGTTYATVGNNLYLDGNPFVRAFNFNQVILLQLFITIIVIGSYLYTWPKQNKILPSNPINFWGFLTYCLKMELTCKLNSKSIKNLLIITGAVIFWVLTVAHLLAGLLNLFPLIGGPSILSLMSSIGFDNFRHSQFVIIIFFVIFSLIVGHYPLYLNYLRISKIQR